MSVTFYPELTEQTMRVRAHRLVCPADPCQDRREFARYELALAAITDHHLHCRDADCRVGDPFVVTDRVGDDEPRVNVASAHAPMVLRALGFLPEIGADAALSHDPDDTEERCGDERGGVTGSLPAPDELAQSGQCPAVDFLARIDLALAPADPGLPVRELGSPTRPSAIVDFGRSPGYLQDRLHRHREVAEYAARGGRAMCWA